MQIAVCWVKQSDFVVWSRKGMTVGRIYKDSGFWSDLKPKLIEFHNNKLKYFEMRDPRRLMPINL